MDVVAVTNLVSDLIKLVVEDHRRALLTLELYADFAISSIKEFNLNMSLLSDFLTTLLLFINFCLFLISVFGE